MNTKNQEQKQHKRPSEEPRKQGQNVNVNDPQNRQNDPRNRREQEKNLEEREEQTTS